MLVLPSSFFSQYLVWYPSKEGNPHHESKVQQILEIAKDGFFSFFKHHTQSKVLFSRMVVLWSIFFSCMVVDMGLHYSHDNRNSVGIFTYSATKMNNIGMNNVSCE
jgi:hypothetical protein